MKYNYGWNMGPRGPMYGRRMRRRPFGGGLTGLLGLFIALPLILPRICGAVVTAGAVFTGLAVAFVGILSGIIRAFFSTAAAAGGVATGIAIGLIVYRMIRNRKEEEQRIREEQTAEETVRSGAATDLAENSFTETESVRNYYASM